MVTGTIEGTVTVIRPVLMPVPALHIHETTEICIAKKGVKRYHKGGKHTIHQRRDNEIKGVPYREVW